jgi:YD repeat-containing protein
VQYLPDPSAAPGPATIINEPVTGILDVDGFLCRPDATDPTLPGAQGVPLVAGDDPDLSVQGWTWTAHYWFSNAKFTIPDHAFFLPSDGALDLTSIVKVPSSTGIGTVQAAALTATAQAAATDSAAYAADAAAAAGVVQAFIDGATSAPAPSQVVVRDSLGRAKFADPAAAADAATKGYTDTALALKLDDAQLGAESGVAPLDSGSRVPEANLPAGLAATALNATYARAFEPSASIVYDGSGNVTSATEGGITTTFTYNADGTVNTETRQGRVRTWAYDANGNPTSSTVV